MNDQDEIALKLPHAYALVLFEFLSRESERMKHDQHRAYEIQYTAERNVMWYLEGALEKGLVEPFKQDYRELVEKARAEVVERGGE